MPENQLERLLKLKNRARRSLDAILQMQILLNFPDRLYPAIHIAGTNGKGSVCTKIANACTLSGKRTGLYTSPHIRDFSERIQIDGVTIADASRDRILSELFALSAQHCLELSFFDMATLLAFVYFAENHVDFAVIETGLGGRWDATNIIRPIAAVITSLGLDHTELLGFTLEEIAHEKAGIIKGNTPVVIGPRVSRALIAPYSERITQPTGNYTTYDEENQATAEAALSLLDIPLNGTTIRPPCRLELIASDKKTVYLDAGHNPEALTALFASLRAITEISRFDVLCAFSKEKDIEACLKVIMQHARHIFVTKASSERAAAPGEIAQFLEKARFAHYTIHDDVDSALQSADSNDHPLLVCGTFYILDNVLSFFQKKSS